MSVFRRGRGTCVQWDTWGELFPKLGPSEAAAGSGVQVGDPQTALSGPEVLLQSGR